MRPATGRAYADASQEDDPLLAPPKVPLANRPGDAPPRPSMYSLVVIPWLVFAIFALLFIFSYHMAPIALSVFAAACVVTCIRQMVVGLEGRRPGGAYPLGLCALATVLGSVAGLHGYGRYMLAYWAVDERRHYEGLRPDAPADAYRDASAITFAAGSQLDLQGSVGHQVGSTMYCVAPIRAWATGTARNDIQYWAAGTNCCKAHGSFMCDSAKDPTALGGLVIESDDIAHYLHATRTAEAQNGVKSIPRPIFVRWVRDFSTTRSTFLREAWLYWFLAGVTYLPFSGVLAMAAPSRLTGIELFPKAMHAQADI